MNLANRYEVIRTLGQGSGGEVYLVRDRVAPGKPLALKTMRGDDEQLADALRLEFQVLAALQHPQLARVHDFGRIGVEDAGGPATFMTRDFLEGEPLSVAAEGATVEEILRLTIGVCRALAPLHDSGLVHGDLKPDNIIVGEDGRVRLIDFGLVRAEGESAQLPAGTLPYIAPEVLRGHEADPRSDLYSLGALLFELLSGAPPFAGKASTVIAAHLGETPPELVLMEGRGELVEEQRASLMGIVERLLAKEPGERYPGVRELEASLLASTPAEPDDDEGAVAVLPGLLGRESALSTLEEALGRRSDQRGSMTPITVVSGGPGSGKSTLFRELKWRAQLAGVNVVEVHCDGAPSPVWPLPALVRHLELFVGVESPAERGAELGDEGERLATRAAAAVRKLRGDAPLLIIVEDAHLASFEALSALRFFAHSELGEGKTHIVVSHCPAEQQAPEKGLAALGEHRLVELQPLRLSDVARLVASILERRDDELARSILEWTGGNPLFSIEILRSIRERGGVTAGGFEGLGVPSRLEEFWVGRARKAGKTGAILLATVAALGRPAERELIERLSELDEEVAERELESLINRGLLREHPSGEIALAHNGLLEVTADLLDGPELEALHGRAADALAERGTSLEEVAHHLLRAGASRRVEGQAMALRAARELIDSGVSRSAVKLLRLTTTHWVGEGEEAAQLLLAEACHGAGEYDSAAAALDLLLPWLKSTEERAEASSLLGRVQAARGEYDLAAKSWGEALELLEEPSDRARVRRDLARMLLKLGDYSSAAEVTRTALGEVDEGDPVRANLLCTAGMSAEYAGDSKEAMRLYDEALEIARISGAKQEESAAHAYRAIALQRRGDYSEARQAYDEGLAAARETGDTGAMALLHGNLGGLAHSEGELVRALEHYGAALKLAQRVGKESTVVASRTNLGLLHLELGEFVRARRELERALESAERLGHKQNAAQATAHLGELAARQQRVDESVELYREACARYEAVGMLREATEVELDLVLALIGRSGMADLREAGERLDSVESAVRESDLTTLAARVTLARARLAAARGEEDRALALYERAERRAGEQGNSNVEWEAQSDAAEVLLRRGAPLAAKSKLRRAVEILEGVAATLPRELRKSYWQDSRRQRTRQTLEEALADSPSRGARSGNEQSMTDMLFRLLEINKRINSDPDLPKLLARIMDSAVELTDAERGFLLLVNEKGELEMTTARDFDQGTPDDAHLQFSRSIAETVLIDGEPVITVNAMDDRRFNEYLSVHQLRLQSVLCIPIRARGRVIGVLYTENRLRRGGFGEPDQRILLAFADQVAIALENSRLMAELTRQAKELERAKVEIEELYEERGKLLNQRTAQLAAARRDLRKAMDQIQGRVGFQGIVGQSKGMQRVFAILERVRQTDVPVVISGDSGTGKEMVARAIHQGGPRSKKPFVAINCGAIPETLLESELFGHVRGSFTGADRDKKGLLLSAHGGTVLLDEIGDMPLKMQLDLLRVLQEKVVRPLGGERDVEIDVRVLAASNRSLRELIQRGTFREDLYYRLSVVEISLPPLRERADDVPLLVDHFLGQIATRFKAEKKGLTREAMRALMNYAWPGNVRQLEHALMNAWVMCDGDAIDVDDLTLDPVTIGDCSEVTIGRQVPTTVRDRREIEKQRILEALEQTGWNKSKAAQVLEMPRRTLYRRLKTYGIQ